MKLDFVLLADAAVVTADGKFSILNGDLGAIETPSFPYVHPYFAMVVKIKGERSEGLEGHVFLAELQDADGTQMVRPAKGLLPFTPNMDETEDSTITAGMVVNFPLLLFSKPGKYTFHLIVDDIEIGTMPLYLRLVSEISSTATLGSDDESGNANMEVTS